MSNPTDGHFIYEDISPDVGVSIYGPRLQQIANAGFAGVMNYSLLSTNTGGMIGYINYAASLGLKVIIAVHTDQYWLWGHINQYPQLYADAGSPGTLQAMVTYIVNQVKNLAGTWGWYIADEPSPVDAAALLAWAGYIRSADNTGKPRLIVESWDDHTKNFAGPSSPLGGNSPWDSTYCEVGGDDFYSLGDTRNVWFSTAAQASYIQATCTARGIGSCMVLQSFSQTRYGFVRVTPYPAGAPYPTAAQMQQQKDAALRNMTPRIMLWFSYMDTIIDWTDTFTVDTSGYNDLSQLIYLKGHDNGGSDATWTWDTVNGRLTSSGGVEAAITQNMIVVANAYVEAILDMADNGSGLEARRVDGNNLYALYLYDASSASSANTFTLEKIVGGGYTSLATGALPASFVRGVKHTFRLSAIGTTMSATMDGVSLASVTDTSVTGAGTFGLIGDGRGGAGIRCYSLSVIPQGTESSATHFANLASVVKSGLSHSLFDEFVYAKNPLRFYRLDDSTGFFAQDSGSQHQDGTINNNGLGPSGSLIGVSTGQASITPIDGQLCMSFNGSTGYVLLPTTGLPSGNQPWTLYAVISIPSVLSGYHCALQFGQVGLYYTTNYNVLGQLECGITGVVDAHITPTVTTNTAYHLGATWDGSNVRVYVNGAKLVTQAEGALNISVNNAHIGQDNTSSFFNGSVSKAIIDNTVWSDADFSNLYAAATKTFPNVKSYSHGKFARIR